MAMTVAELRAQIEELTAAHATSEAERRDVQEEVSALRIALGHTEADVRRLEPRIDDAAMEEVRARLAEPSHLQIATQAAITELKQMLCASLARDVHADCPRLPWLQKASNDRYRLYFVCPVALEVAETNGGGGYDIHLPKAALRTLAPALRVTIHALRCKLGSERTVGLPLRNNRANRTPQAIRRAEAAAITAFERLLPPPDDARMASQPVGAVPHEAYRLLRATLETEDPGLARCGLVRQEAVDKTIAWVRAGSSSERFCAEGARCLGQIQAAPVQLVV